MDKSFAVWPAMPRSQEASGYPHQVKNLLAIVRVIAASTGRNTQDLDDFTAHFDGRLAALGRTQHMLSRADAFEIDLEELVRDELLAHGEKHPQVEGPDIFLSQKAAETLGLALHELATNAVKFGALTNAGSLKVAWRIDADWLVLEWRETGVPAVDPYPAKWGFGRDWIERGLPYQLGGESRMEFLPGGVACTIRLPLDHAARPGGDNP